MPYQKIAGRNQLDYFWPYINVRFDLLIQKMKHFKMTYIDFCPKFM